MSFFYNLVIVLQVLAAMAMIGLILVQHGKGADMGAAFGSGASGSLFGATGSANFLSRATAILATVFFVCTLALTYFAFGARTANPSGGSVLDAPAAMTPAAVQNTASAAEAADPDASVSAEAPKSETMTPDSVATPASGAASASVN